jgi:hypothetical protein
LIQLIKEYCDQFKVQELPAFIFDQLMAPHYDFYNVKLRTPETRLLHFLTWWETTRNSELVLRRDPNDPESYTTTKITIRYEQRTLQLRTALGQPKPVTRIWFTLILPIDAKMTYEELAIVIHEQLKDDKPKCNIIYQKQSVPHNITTFSRFEVEADSRFTQDPRFAVVNGPRGIQPLSAESTNARRTCGLQLTIDGIPRAVTMKMPGITWQSAQHGLLRKAAAHAAEMRATAAQEAVNQEDASQEAARQAAALAAAERAAADQEEAAQADARQAVALAAAERAAADQEEAAAGRATAKQEEADQATTVLAAAGRAAADQEEGPFTMVPTNPKRERAAATTPGNSPPRTRKSTTTAQQRKAKFWGDNSDEETDEDTPMSGSDDEANGDIVEKITTTATDAGKRAAWVAKPLQAQRNAEKQKWRATNHERLDAIVEQYARELGHAEEIRTFFLQYRELGTQSARVAIFKPLYLTAVKRFRNSRQFRDQMKLINCPMQINVVDLGPLFGGDDPAAAILITFRSIADAVAAHELLMELHHKNEWPPFALEFVTQDI